MGRSVRERDRLQRRVLGDRWVAIACWTDDEWASLAAIIGIDDPSLATFDARLARVNDVEALVGAWTVTRRRIKIADTSRPEASRPYRCWTTATSTPTPRWLTAFTSWP